MLEVVNLETGKIYFVSQFERFQSMSNWPRCFGPVAGSTLWQEHIIEEIVLCEYLMVARNERG
jgi:hypothetical protein